MQIYIARINFAYRRNVIKETPNAIYKHTKQPIIDFKHNLRLLTSTSGNKVLELK